MSLSKPLRPHIHLTSRVARASCFSRTRRKKLVHLMGCQITCPRKEQRCNILLRTHTFRSREMMPAHDISLHLCDQAETIKCNFRTAEARQLHATREELTTSCQQNTLHKQRPQQAEIPHACANSVENGTQCSRPKVHAKQKQKKANTDTNTCNRTCEQSSTKQMQHTQSGTGQSRSVVQW